MVSLNAAIAASPRFGRLPALAPGLALTAVLAGVAFALRLIPGVATLSAMILAVLLGVAAIIIVIVVVVVKVLIRVRNNNKTKDE